MPKGYHNDGPDALKSPTHMWRSCRKPAWRSDNRRLGSADVDSPHIWDVSEAYADWLP